MGATTLEFRLRMLINAMIIVLGVWAPWVSAEKRVLVTEWLPLEIARMRLAPFSAAVPIVVGIACAFAALGAILRVWGTAYLGPATVVHLNMRAESVVASGPYRYLRNPLYVGLWCTAAGIAVIMPPLGAALALVLLALFQARLALGEEAFLSAQLGEPYRAYLKAVPRFLPRLRNNLPRTRVTPKWGRALLAELTPISVLIAVAVLFWSYEVRLVGRIILIGFGLSLVVAALEPSADTKSGAPE